MPLLVDTQITNTPIGQLFMWDTLADVQLDVLENAVVGCRRILNNPSRFPNADFAGTRWKLEQIDASLRTYGDHLAEIAV